MDHEYERPPKEVSFMPDTNEVNPYPDPTRPNVLPILRIETDDALTGKPLSPLSPASSGLTSPSTKMQLYYAKKKYSTGDDDLRLQETVVFDKREIRQKKKGPSSPTTVLTMAGLFVCGVTLMLSGLIVLCQQNERAFIITGAVFLAVGGVMVIICGILQRKNVIKYMVDMNRDLYFLKMSDSYMWKLMFKDEDSTLPKPPPYE
uniref:Transmembrane protein 186 n=1 Tax=Panagrellus redivivus TaxID=6233 RepID=A0A7E4VB31_PANRE